MLPLHTVSLSIYLSTNLLLPTIPLSVRVYVIVSPAHAPLPSQKSGFMGLRTNAKYMYTHITWVYSLLNYCTAYCGTTAVCERCSGITRTSNYLRDNSDKIASRWNWWCFVIIITLSTNFKRDTNTTLAHTRTLRLHFTIFYEIGVKILNNVVCQFSHCFRNCKLIAYKILYY